MMVLRFVGLVAVLLAGCSGKTTAGRCTGPGGCAPGSICIDGICVVVCVEDSHCEAGERCIEGACTVASQDDPPVILSVDGTGSVDGATGHTNRHLRDRLMITGLNLLGADATLTGVNPSRPSVSLLPCEVATDTQLEVALPTDVVAGDYLLSLANQGGSCDASLSLLQGEAGSLSASGAQLVGSINTAIAADPTLQVAGALAGDVTTIAAAASVSTPSARSIRINGAEQVDSTTAGIYLSVLDLSTHLVVDQPATTLFRTKQVFAAGTQLEHDGLRDVLDTLGDEHIVVLASAGDITAMAVDPTLAAKLRNFGASPAFDSLAADEAWTLIGTRAIGGGNGLERVSGVARGGYATIATVAIDDAVVGIELKGGAPQGLIGFFAGACPPGWTEYNQATGRVVVGAGAGTVGGTVGTALSDQGTRTITNVAAHTHTVNPPATTTSNTGAHTHTLPRYDDYGSQYGTDRSADSGTVSTSSAGNHTHSVDIPQFNSGSTGSASVDVTMPYVQLRACRRD